MDFEQARSHPLEIRLEELVHPYLFLDQDEADALRTLAADPATEQHGLIGALKEKAGRWLALGAVELSPIPDGGPATTCPHDGQRLVWDVLKPRDHVCPKCERVLQGPEYDRAWRAASPFKIGRLARELGILYTVTGEKVYAAEVARLLQYYADSYSAWPARQMGGGMVRAGPSPLHETAWVLGLTAGYDLIWHSGSLSDADKRSVEDGLFRPAADLLLLGQGDLYVTRVGGGIANYRNCTLSGVAAIGFLLRDHKLVEFALNGPVGVLRQLDEGVLTDGVWFEDSPNYHMAEIRDFLCAAETAWHSGIDLYRHPKFFRMFQALMALAFPDGSLPSTNDCHNTRRLDQLGVQWAAAVFFHRTGNAEVAALLDPGRLPPASDDFLLDWSWMEQTCWWVTPTWPGGNRERRSVNLPHGGKAVLRTAPPAPAVDVIVDYGPHGNGHGHYDKPQLVLYANGRLQAPDPGIGDYDHEMAHCWYRTTLAHNTVVVNGRSQKSSTGQCHLFAVSPRFKIADVSPIGFDQESLAPQEFLRRIVALADESFLIDIFRSAAPGVQDWVYHNFGTFRADQPLAARPGPLGEDEGYQYVRNVRAGPVLGSAWRGTFMDGDQGVRLTGLADPGMEILAGEGPGMGDWLLNEPGTMPLVIIRRPGPGTWRTVIEPFRDTPRIQALGALEVCASGDLPNEQGIGLQVIGRERVDYLLVGYTWGEKRFGDISFDGHAAYLQYEAGSDPLSSRPEYAFMAHGTRLKCGPFLLQTDRHATCYLQRKADERYTIHTVAGFPGDFQVQVADA